MAITRADLETTRSSSTKALILVIAMLLLGLAAFGLCLIAETARTQVVWEPVSIPNLLDSDAFTDVRCSYTTTGGAALACATSAFVAMLAALGVSLSKTHLLPLRPLDVWNSSALRWQASIFLLASWASFAVALALLLIGIILEAGILFQSSKKETRDQCLVVGQGLFTGAGIFSLASTAAMSAFYLAGIHALKTEQRRYELPASPSTRPRDEQVALEQQASRDSKQVSQLVT